MQFTLWISAILSSFLDNIPFVATMIPLLKEVQASSTFTFDAVWWALSIGSCIGGAGTIIGASANVVTKGICEDQEVKISFVSYMKVAYPIMLLLVLISSLYLTIRFIL
jgi:Na+/H+ antiporter NhaD/arsenite permease-like protein